MIDKIFEKVVTWAETEDVIKVIIIEGSRARHDHSVEQFSDYDLNLYVTDVAQFTKSDTWIKQISPIEVNLNIARQAHAADATSEVSY